MQEEVAVAGRRKKTSPTDEPSAEDIRVRAYELYLERGGQDGNEVDDWVRAEKELRQRSRESREARP